MITTSGMDGLDVPGRRPRGEARGVAMDSLVRDDQAPQPPLQAKLVDVDPDKREKKHADTILEGTMRVVQELLDSRIDK